MRLPLTHTCANPTTNQQKKPRQGRGAREIREIRTIQTMKPLQTLKGSTQSADHLRRLADLDPLPQIAAEPEGCTDAKQRKGARHRIDKSTPAGPWASCIVSYAGVGEISTRWLLGDSEDLIGLVEHGSSDIVYIKTEPPKGNIVIKCRGRQGWS